MKINEVEKVTGITSSNIRYYEKKELLVPQRGNENNYRLYSTDDIERLKQIKILRMMGISISDIKDIFEGKTDFKTTVSQRLDELEAEEQNIKTVKKCAFCKHWYAVVYRRCRGSIFRFLEDRSFIKNLFPCRIYNFGSCFPSYCT